MTRLAAAPDIAATITATACWLAIITAGAIAWLSRRRNR